MWDSDVSCENLLVIFPLSLTSTFSRYTSLLSALIVFMTLDFVCLEGKVIHLLVWQSSSITSLQVVFNQALGFIYISDLILNLVLFE